MTAREPRAVNKLEVTCHRGDRCLPQRFALSAFDDQLPVAGVVRPAFRHLQSLMPRSKTMRSIKSRVPFSRQACCFAWEQPLDRLEAQEMESMVNQAFDS